MTRKELEKIIHEVAGIVIETPWMYNEGGGNSPVPGLLEHKLQEYLNQLNNMETVRGKFTCTKAVETSYGKETTFWALYSNNPEDNQYAQATPAGNVTMLVSNPTAKEFFKEGQVYYLDFVKA